MSWTAISSPSGATTWGTPKRPARRRRRWRNRRGGRALITPTLVSRPSSRPSGEKREKQENHSLSPLSPRTGWVEGRERGGWGSEGSPLLPRPLPRRRRIGEGPQRRAQGLEGV